MAPPNYADVKVLVTGARGFLGRHLCRALVQAQARVYALHRSAPELGSDLAGTQSLYADITSPEQLHEALSPLRPDVVFHLAGCINRDVDRQAILQTFAVNAIGTHNLIQVLADHPPQIMVLSSTGDVYGHDFPPFREESKSRPETPYAASKATAWTWAKASTVPCVEGRLFIVYGPHQGPRMFLPQLMEALVQQKTLPMTPGEQTRDFTWVDDAVQGLLFLGRRPDLVGEAFNVCTGRETSLRQVIGLLGNIVGRPIPVDFGAVPYRPREVFRNFGDPSKLAAQGFRCETALEIGLARWYKALKEKSS